MKNKCVERWADICDRTQGNRFNEVEKSNEN